MEDLRDLLNNAWHSLKQLEWQYDRMPDKTETLKEFFENLDLEEVREKISVIQEYVEQDLEVDNEED